MSLSELSIERLSRAAPELTKYVQTFRDMTDEMSQDSGIQVGVFVLANGGSQFFIPVVAKAGTVFPIDLIYFADEHMFMPITKKTVDRVITSSTSSFGKNTKTPQFAIKNPDLNELVVPPKTGKFMYASSSRLGEFMALLPSHLVDRLTAALISDEHNLSNPELQNLRDIIQTLKTRSKVEEKISGEFPQVITDGVGLPEEIVAEIMSKGYSVQNAPEDTVAALSYESGNSHSYSYLSVLEQGKAFNFITRTGEEVALAVLPRLRNPGMTASQEIRRSDMIRKKAIPNYLPMLLGAGGSIRVLTDDECGEAVYGNDLTCKLMRAVVVKQELPYREILDTVKSYPITDLPNVVGMNGLGEFKYIVSTPRGFIGPFVSKPQVDNGHISLGDVIFHESYPASGYWSDGSWLFGTGCTFIPVFSDNPGCGGFLRGLCTDINVAQMRNDMKLNALMPNTIELSYHNGNYAIDKQVAGDAASTISELIIKQHLSVKDAEGFMKEARDNTSRKVLIRTALVKSAATESTRRTPIPEYGARLAPQESGTGTKADRERGSMLSTSIAQAAKLRDSQVVEATIMSEILQDQDLTDTIEEYLPDIKSAVDKLGRVLLLSRIHSAKLNDDMDSEGVSNLVTSIRNSFKLLGENYTTLEQMALNGNQ